MVLTFVNALNVCDHKTIRALTTAGYPSSATRWCNRGTHDVQVAGFRIGGASDGVDLTFKVRHRDIILGERLWMNDFHRRCWHGNLSTTPGGQHWPHSDPAIEWPEVIGQPGSGDAKASRQRAPTNRRGGVAAKSAAIRCDAETPMASQW